MKAFVFLILTLSLVFSAPVVLVIDSSGSMEDPLPSGEIKIDAAKDAAKGFISGSSSEVAVMQFSGCTDTYSDPDPMNGEIRVIQGFTTDKLMLTRAIDGISPYGDTPIYAAIQEAVAYLNSEAKQNGVIVLLTDGEETCYGGDPAEAAAYAYSNGYAVVNVVAYDLSESALADAQRIATSGGGKVYTANAPAELEQALQQASGSTGDTVACCVPVLIFGFVGLFVLTQKGIRA